jgi:thiol-disulfide isomerase/thioredoxin
MKRRALLIGGAAAAGGTLAVAWQRGKPGVQTIHTLTAQPAPPEVRLLGIEVLKRIEPPAPMPPAALVDASGAVHGLAEFAGKGLVINLWATWCVPCVAELPALAALAGRVKDGILVLPLSSDRGGAPVVEAFYRKHGIEGLPVWLDPKGAAAQAWGARGIPTTLIIDRQGRERGRLEGAVDWASDAAPAAIRGLVG